MMDLSISPRGLFLFREVYHPQKPNLSKLFSYAYVVCALILIACYVSDIPGLRCSMDTYVSACEEKIINPSQCDNLLIVDCELDCTKKGLDLGSTCDYEPCKQGMSCWQTGQNGQGGNPQACGNGCEKGSSGYIFKDYSTVSGPSTCTDYLLQQQKIATDPTYSSLPKGVQMGGLKKCCGVLKEYEVCLKPSAVIGVIGGYLGLLMSIFQVLYIFCSKSMESDIFKKWMGDYHIDDPFIDYHRTKKVKTDSKTVEYHHPPSSTFQTVEVENNHISHVTTDDA